LLLPSGAENPSYAAHAPRLADPRSRRVRCSMEHWPSLRRALSVKSRRLKPSAHVELRTINGCCNIYFILLCIRCADGLNFGSRACSERITMHHILSERTLRKFT